MKEEKQVVVIERCPPLTLVPSLDSYKGITHTLSSVYAL